jgi:hypothetical protein
MMVIIAVMAHKNAMRQVAWTMQLCHWLACHAGHGAVGVVRNL